MPTRFTLEPIKIGETTIGPNHRPYVVAEIGINHNGDMALAKETMQAAKESGADAVKFQNYKTDDFISDRTLTYEYISQGKTVIESQYDMFSRYELSDDQVRDLAGFANEISIDFHATPTGKRGIDLLMEIGVDVLKNGSDFLGHLPLIRQMGETGLPTVLSTGMADQNIIANAVNAFAETGNSNLILLHCVSKYPTPVEELNLSRMKTLADTFECHVGFSDHSMGSLASAIATSMGSVWIEKHFTLDRNLPGPDHRFSSNQDEMTELAKTCREASFVMGNPSLSNELADAAMKAEFALSCVAARDIATGTELSDSDIEFRRPGGGIEPNDKDQLVGCRLKSSMSKGAVFDFKEIERVQ